MTEKNLIALLERAREEGLEDPRLVLCLPPLEKALELRLVAEQDGQQVNLSARIQLVVFEHAKASVADRVLDELAQQLGLWMDKNKRASAT